MARRRALIPALIVVVLAGGGIAALLARDDDDEGDRPERARASQPRQRPPASARSLARAVTVAGIVEHMRALQRIADAVGGNRAAGTRGDRASQRYAADRLRAAGWRVRLQAFRFPYSAQRSPPRLEAGGRQIETTALRFSASGSVSAPLALAGSGCEEADYSGFSRESVALVRRGDCLLREIVRAAERAGAAAVVVYAPDVGGPPRPGTLISPGTRIPALSVRREDGRDLADRLPQVRVEVDSVSELRRSSNVIAELGTGSRVAMAGGHLDSVPEGPGINDNASGVGTLLELAEEMGVGRGRAPRRVRLAFWGAEELGLYGSRHYVRELPRDERERIAAYLNLDMVGSANGGRLIYGGRRGEAARATRAVRGFFADRGEPLENASVGQASDHAPFEAAGVPTIGLYSGSSEVKSERQADEWGGREGRPFDACYHLSCDRLDRIDARTLSELSDAAAIAVFALAHP